MSSTAAPPRGSRDYYARIFETAEQDELNSMTPRLHALWEDYGFRSTIDVMTEWVCAIDFIIPTNAHYRDFTGVVRMDLWNVEHLLNPGFMLQQAVRASNEAAAVNGTPLHEEFHEANSITTRLLDNINLWRPTLARALRVAYAEKERDPVRAVLIQGPGVRERDWFTLRDGAVYLFQLASWPIRAAKGVGRPVRPPKMGWLTQDITIPPSMALVLSPEGELRHEH